MNFTGLDYEINVSLYFFILLIILFITFDMIYKKIIYGKDTFSIFKEITENYLVKKFHEKNEKRKIKEPEILFSKIATFVTRVINIQRFLTKPIVLVGVFFLYFEIFEINILHYPPSYFNELFIFNPNDRTTLDIVKLISNSFKFLIPITLPFYYFSYREQKSMSDSSVNGKTRSSFYLLFIFSSLATVIYSFNLSAAFKESLEVKDNSLSLTDLYIHDLSLIIFYSFLSLYFLVSFVIDFLLSLSLKKTLRKKMNKVFINYTLLSFSKSEKSHKFFYDQLTYQVESVYQLLRQAAEKEIGELYGTHNKEWGKILDYILMEYRLASFDTTTKHLYLLKKSGVSQNSLYKTILKNHVSLIRLLVDIHKIEDAKRSISSFMSLIPKPTMNKIENDTTYNKYLSNYYVTLYELSLFLYEEKNVNLYPILDSLKNESESNEAVELEGILRNFQSLLIKAVEKNDINTISTISYHLNNFFYKSGYGEIEEDKEVITDSKFDDILELKEIELESDNNLSDAKLNSNYSLSSIFLLLQVLAKSIEISNYKCSGFIVKFLVTNIKSEDLEIVLNEFKNNFSQNIFLIKSENYGEIDTDFHFNGKIKQYILTKIALIIYIQQIYIMDRKVKLWISPKTHIDLNLYIDIDNISYIFDKINVAKSKYGLLSLQDEKTIEKAKRFLKVGNSLSERIVIVDKLPDYL